MICRPVATLGVDFFGECEIRFAGIFKWKASNGEIFTIYVEEFSLNCRAMFHIAHRNSQMTWLQLSTVW